MEAGVLPRQNLGMNSLTLRNVFTCDYILWRDTTTYSHPNSSCFILCWPRTDQTKNKSDGKCQSIQAYHSHAVSLEGSSDEPMYIFPWSTIPRSSWSITTSFEQTTSHSWLSKPVTDWISSVIPSQSLINPNSKPTIPLSIAQWNTALPYWIASMLHTCLVSHTVDAVESTASDISSIFQKEAGGWLFASLF